MSTVTVPLKSEDESLLDMLFASGYANNKAAILRKALHEAAEEVAIMNVLKSESEVKAGKTLKGDIRDFL